MPVDVEDILERLDHIDDQLDALTQQADLQAQHQHVHHDTLQTILNRLNNVTATPKETT